MRRRAIALRWLLLAAAVILTMLFSTPHAYAAGVLTLPFTQANVPVNSWFDHNYPGSGNNNNMVRYDGATWTDGSAYIDYCTLTVNCYDGHNGIDYGLASGSTVVAAASGAVQFIGWQDPQNHYAGFGCYSGHQGTDYAIGTSGVGERIAAAAAGQEMV